MKHDISIFDDQKPKYEAPDMEKHEPLKVVQGSGGGGGGCSGLYYTALYYWK